MESPNSDSSSLLSSTPSSPLFEHNHTLLNSSSFLLHLIDPIRIYSHTPPSSSPTNTTATTSRSEDTNSSEKLKRRLIDALAFICATERESDTGAAVCLEESVVDSEDEDDGSNGQDGGYTLRIANNGWVGEEVLVGVREIVRALEAFADGSNLYHHTDAQVYGTIISLHLSKVLYHLSEIREPITVVQEAFELHLSAMDDEPQRIHALSNIPPMESKKLQTWLRTFVGQVIAADEAGERRLPITAVTAAYQVRRSPIFAHLETLCKSVGCQIVGVHMLKLGRYKAACKTLLHACQKWPGLFLGMRVEGVPEVEEDLIQSFDTGPRPTREVEIRRILEEIAQRDDPEASVEEAVQALLPTISEEQFTTAWASRVSSCTGHAEVRLVEFYEEHPEFRPISGSTDPKDAGVRYIGMSKKPCYLCQMFIDRHPAKYMPGGLEGEKPGAGVKRILDPFWRLRPVGGADYARILDDVRESVEQELKTEVERWVSRGSDEEVLGRERPRLRTRSKAKRVTRVKRKQIEPETSSSSNGSSSDGGGALLNPPIAGDDGIPALAEAVESPAAAGGTQAHDVAMSEDEGEGVRLVQNTVEEPAPASVEEAPEEFPDLILPTADVDSDAVHAAAAAAFFSPSTSPPPPHLIDDDAEYGLLSPNITGTETASSSEMQSINQLTYAPFSTDYHSETQYFEESEFKLLSPIPEEEDEALVLVNLETVLVRLAHLEGKNDSVQSVEQDEAPEPVVPQRARAFSDAERDLFGLDFTVIAAEVNELEPEPEPEHSASQVEESETPAEVDADAGKLAPGGYLVPEEVEEASTIGPGGYFVVEPAAPTAGYYVVAAEQAGVVLPGGYLAAEPKVKEEGAFAPGGYLVAEIKGDVEVSTLIGEAAAAEVSQTQEENIENAELAPGGYMTASAEGWIVTGGYFAVVSGNEGEEVGEEEVVVVVPQDEGKADDHNDQLAESSVLVEAPAAAESSEEFDVIDIEQERARARAQEAQKAAAPTPITVSIPMASSSSSSSAAAAAEKSKLITTTTVTVRELGTSAAALGSSPSSSTHTTLSTSTTLAANTPTTPRHRYSASSLFSPSLRRASTWAPPTTATTITTTPAITTTLSGDSVIISLSRPGTAGADMVERKSVDFSSIPNGGWMPKKLMRVVTSDSLGSTITSMEVPEDAVLPRRASFSGIIRPSSVNGDKLTGTAKALATLRGLQAQVRQKRK